MAPRYCFPLPDETGPVGGMNIQYRIMRTLREAGYRTVALHEGSRYRYPFADPGAEVESFPKLMRGGPPVALGRRLRSLVRPMLFWRPSPARAQRVNPRFVPDAQDVFVLPEYNYGEVARRFPRSPLILAAQDAFMLAKAFARDRATPDPQGGRFDAVYTTSATSTAAVRTLLGREPSQLRLPVDAASLEPQPKMLQIAYMPRKRKQEADLVLNLLRARMGTEMPPVVAITRMTDAERDRALRESLFFLSFSHREGFGLPPAEAMAAGCIVVGYTGVGGNEFFTPKTGFPVEDSDVIGFVATVERLLRDYQRNPAPLDALRTAAAAHIRAAYDPEVWRRHLLDVWAAIDRDIHATLKRQRP